MASRSVIHPSIPCSPTLLCNHAQPSSTNTLSTSMYTRSNTASRPFVCITHNRHTHRAAIHTQRHGKAPHTAGLGRVSMCAYEHTHREWKKGRQAGRQQQAGCVSVCLFCLPAHPAYAMDALHSPPPLNDLYISTRRPALYHATHTHTRTHAKTGVLSTSARGTVYLCALVGWNAGRCDRERGREGGHTQRG